MYTIVNLWNKPLMNKLDSSKREALFEFILKANITNCVPKVMTINNE